MSTTNLYILTATTVNLTQTAAAIPTLQFFASANTQYNIHASGSMMVSGTTSAGTGGIIFKLTVPAGTEANVQPLLGSTSASSFKSNVLTVNNDSTNVCCTVNNTELSWLFNGLVDGGATGGTVSIGFRNAAAGQNAYINKYSSMVVVS